MNKKALCLISGGLDSLIAIRILQEQGIECIGINFISPFFSNKMSDNDKKNFSFDYREINVGEDFLGMVRNPPNGHGSHMNPCIDCKIYMLKKAKSLLAEFGASFIATGEVLGQRPMSQHRVALNKIEKQAGVDGILLRPLSALHLDETLPEKEGIVDRARLLDISGRGRKIQLELSKKYKIEGFSTPAGGCLLAEEFFADKLRDLINSKPDLLLKEVEILKYGRHFRYNGSKIIVGRNNFENDKLMELKGDKDISFVVPNCGSPTSILQDVITEETVRFAASLTAFYSDCKNERVIVEYDSEPFKIEVELPKREDIDKYNLQIRK